MKQFFLGLVVATVIAASAAAFAQEVNVYSARKEALIKPLFDRFTAQTGIVVNLVTAKADALLERLKAEGDNTPADVLITVDAGRLHAAKEAGLLKPLASDTLTAAVPVTYRDPDGTWFGLSLRTRPIMYAKARVSKDELSTYEALADPQWKGRICVRSSDNVYNQSLVASVIESIGEAPTLAWLEGLVANFARSPKGGDRDQIKAVAAGQCDIAIANTYYLAQMLASEKESDREAADQVAVFWPNQNDRGTHVNVSGAGVTRAAKREAEAQKLLEFLVSDAAQTWYADVNHERRVSDGTTTNEVINGFGRFKPDTVSLARLGANNAAAVKLMDKAGWK